MAGPTSGYREPVAAGVPLDERLSGLRPDYVRAVIEALEEGRTERVLELVKPLHSAEAADLVESLRSDQRDALIDVLRPDLDPEILAELDETVCEHVVEQLGVELVAAAIAELDSDDAVDVIEDLEEEVQQQVLREIPAEERVILEDSLAYPEESAGRMMQRELVAVAEKWTVGEIIDFLREEDDLPHDFYDIFVVDPRHHPIGIVSLSRVLRTKRPVPVGEIMNTSLKLVPVATDQEEVAFLFRQHNVVSAPVVDEDGRLVGMITVDDVVDVIDEEAEEDIMRMGGVIGDDFYGAVIDTTRSRFNWLFVNLGTAFLASMVIAQFESTIERFVSLAVLMPIVASMGGNAGTQTLTVSVRALAMKELTSTNALRVVGKEVLVNSVNGVLFAVIAGLLSWWWFGNALIGSIIAAAMVINLVVAGLAGTAIPIGLTRIGIDPAIASGTFLTTVTDVVGFLAFLGLASLFLM